MSTLFERGNDINGTATRAHFKDRSTAVDLRTASPADTAAPSGEVRRTVDEPMPLPTRPPVSTAGVSPTLRRIMTPSGLASPAATGTQFGVGEVGTQMSDPPDTTGALDTQSFMVMTNQAVWGYAKNSQGVYNSMFLDDFFTATPAPASVDLFDPVIIRDPLGNQCVAVALNKLATGAPGIYLGSTYESDVMGNWQYYWIGADQLNLNPGEWVDFPKVGTNSEFLAVTVNIYTGVKPSAVYVTTLVLVMDLVGFYATGATNLVTFRGQVGSTTVPCRTHDAAAPLWMVSTNDSNISGDCSINLYSITGSFAANNVAITAATVLTAPGLAYNTAGPNPGGAQLGTTQTLDVGDSRMQSAVIWNNMLWCVHGVWLPLAGPPTNTGVNVYCIDTSGAAPVLAQSMCFEDPTAATSYGAPSIAVNSLGDVLIGMSMFNSSAYPQGTYTSRAAGDPPNTLRNAASTIASSTNWTSNNRWGDYSATIVDTNDQVSFWTLQEACGVWFTTRWFTKWMNVPQIT